MYGEDGCMVRTATGAGVGWVYDEDGCMMSMNVW